MNIAPLFATPIIKINMSRWFTESEMDCIANIPMYKEEKDMGNHRSEDFYLFDNTFAEELQEIKKFCEYELKRYLVEIEGVDIDLAGLKISQCWLNKTGPDEYHHKHSHPNSYLSGVLYINCLPQDFIIFENRLEGMYNNTKFPKKEMTEWNTNATAIDIEKGDLVIFPSWVPHYVNRNETKDIDRISLSFNTIPTGKMKTWGSIY